MTAESLMISAIDVSSSTIDMPATSKPPDNTAVPLKVVSTTAPEPLPSYVLYDPDDFNWNPISSDDYATEAARALTDIYGQECEIVKSAGWDYSKFISWWNALPSKVGGVIIKGHANPKVMVLDTPDNTGIWNYHIDGIDMNGNSITPVMKIKDIDFLLLAGCNTALVGYDDCLTIKFAGKIKPTGRVVGADGYRMYYPWGGSNISEKADIFGSEKDFAGVLKSHGVPDRPPKGWVCYYFSEANPVYLNSVDEYKWATLLYPDDYKRIYYETLRLYKYSASYSNNKRREVNEPLFNVWA